MFLRLYISVFIFSIALLVWQHVGMNNTLVLDNNTVGHAVSDLDIIGDPNLATTTTLTTNTTHLLTCQIKHQYTYPFCELNFNLNSVSEKYINLTGFEYIDLTLRYETPLEDSNRLLRIQMRSFSPQYSDVSNVNSYKLNEAKLYVNPSDELKTYRTYLDDFFVPEWWLKEMKLGASHTLTDFTRVLNIKVMTPETISSGEHVIELESIILYGKWITLTQLKQVIITLFGSLFFVNIVFFIRNLNMNKKQILAKQLELIEINQALQIETQELKGLIRRDQLTGIRNRHGIRDLVVKLLTKTADSDFHLSAMYLDLDNFKEINDKYGHDVGDQVLIRFARLISNNIRDNDVFARWGGEEFILISPEYNCSKAQLLAEKLRVLVENESWPALINVTCSIGVTEYKAGEEFSELLKRADTALYRSKSEGRNRTTVI